MVRRPGADRQDLTQTENGCHARTRTYRNYNTGFVEMRANSQLRSQANVPNWRGLSSIDIEAERLGGLLNFFTAKPPEGGKSAMRLLNWFFAVCAGLCIRAAFASSGVSSDR